MDDRKTSHEDKSMIESIAYELEKKFGKMSSGCCCPDYDFLGMELKFANRKVRVDMHDHFRKAVDMIGEPNLTPAMLPSKIACSAWILIRQKQRKQEEIFFIAS